MRTSGHDNRDALMVTIPAAILVVYALVAGGGPRQVLHTIELTLFSALDWVTALF